MSTSFSRKSVTISSSSGGGGKSSSGGGFSSSGGGFSSSGGSISSSGGGYSMSSSRKFGSAGGSMSISSSMRPAMSSSYSLQSYGTRPRISQSYGYGGYQSLGLSLGSGSAFRAGSGSSHMSIMSGGLVNEKDTMQNLNQRLSIYLEKVRSLETSNGNLEKQIREFVSSRTVDSFDWSIYNTSVKPLQQQIINYMLQNARIALEVDNARLAAEDFRIKWETELMLRQSVENDINGLHQLKDTYVQLQANVASDITGLEEEITYLRKNHEEELRMLRLQKTQDVQVEVESMPSTDLTETLQQLRNQYTELANKNQQDLDIWYKEQVAIKVTQTSQSNQAVDGAKTQLSQLRHQMQSLDAEYNSISGSLSALQNTLNSTEGRYASELQRIMGTVAHLEGELGGIRNHLMSQSQQYQLLLNIKMQLDAELHQYKILLDGGSQSIVHSGSSSSSMTSGSHSSMTAGSKTTTTKVVTERVSRY